MFCEGGGGRCGYILSRRREERGGAYVHTYIRWTAAVIRYTYIIIRDAMVRRRTYMGGGYHRGTGTYEVAYFAAVGNAVLMK